MSEIAQRYERHADAFERLIRGADPERWRDPSPCAGWTAIDVVDHIVTMHAVMLRPIGREPTPGPAVVEDPLAAFRAARADVEALLFDPEIANTECDTPAGRMTVAQHVDQVVSDDMVMHGWDLARATGQDDAMDPDDVQRLWESTSAIPAEVMERYRTPGAFGPGIEVFGPEVVVAPDAPLQDRLLGLIGRDPSWAPGRPSPTPGP